jgi:hypothetical protein
VKTLFTTLLAGCALCGCARFSTVQTDTSYDDTGAITRKITTRASATTFFEAKSALATFRATQTDKTQSASAGGLNQEASATNLVHAIEATSHLIEEIGKLKSPTPLP